MPNSDCGIWKVVVQKGGSFEWPSVVEEVLRPKLGDRFAFSLKKGVVFVGKVGTTFQGRTEIVEEGPDGLILRLPKRVRMFLRLKEGDVLVFSVKQNRSNVNDVSVRFWKKLQNGG